MLLLNDKDETGLSSKNATKSFCQAVMKYTTSYAKATNKSSQADTDQEVFQDHLQSWNKPTERQHNPPEICTPGGRMDL